MNTATTRRPATESDAAPGAVLYKGNGKAALTVTGTWTWFNHGEPVNMVQVTTPAGLKKQHTLRALTVEVDA